jgi:hypothetical protein
MLFEGLSRLKTFYQSSLDNKYDQIDVIHMEIREEPAFLCTCPRRSPAMRRNREGMLGAALDVLKLFLGIAPIWTDKHVCEGPFVVHVTSRRKIESWMVFWSESFDGIEME